MRNRFVSIGECMVEMAPTGEGTYRMGFAGDTLNTAWYVRKLLPANWTVSYVTGVGVDSISDRMLDFFRSAQIDTSDVLRSPGKTVGLYMIQLDDGERSFSYWRSDSAARQIAADAQALAESLAGAEMIYFSGISLAILPQTDRRPFLQALANARSQGSTIAFDPNLRPRLWETTTEMCEAITEAAQVSNIVLPSYEDEAVHFGDETPLATANRYAAGGARLVIVKNGPEDLISLAEGIVSTHAAVPAADVVDTTAAGDSFNAGFLSAYLQGGDLQGAVQSGNRIASAVIGARGALVDVVAKV
ncbi:sugar kinase [Roseibium sp.]|uniref:sugar kinase n=1 Tax=Roseibium sp. TaxID=1936156 RepID=UPI003A975399